MQNDLITIFAGNPSGNMYIKIIIVEVQRTSLRSRDLTWKEMHKSSGL